MENSAFIVLSNPINVDREREYNRWYSEIHVPEMLALPQVVSARRYQVANLEAPFLADGVSGRRYLAIYEVAAGSMSSMLTDMEAARHAGAMTFSDDLEMTPPPLSVAVRRID